MKEKIKIGVMGCANIAEKSVIPAIIEHPNYELVAVASRTKEKAEGFAAAFSCLLLDLIGCQLGTLN